MDAPGARQHVEETPQWLGRYRAAARALSREPHMIAALHNIHRVAGADRATMGIVTGVRPGYETVRGRIVAFSGSFNPLTLAHIGLVDSALAKGFDTVVWMLPAASVDKERVTRAALADRIVQMRAYALSTERPHRQALALVNRGLYVEQARLLRQRFLEAEIALLVGFDKVEQIFDVRYYQDRDAALGELFRSARLLVAPRAGAGEAELTALLRSPENARFAERVELLPVSPALADDSSTEARAIAASGDMIALRSLVPPEAVALAETGAYEPTVGTESTDDRYGRRLAWLRQLEQG